MVLDYRELQEAKKVIVPEALRSALDLAIEARKNLTIFMRNKSLQQLYQRVSIS